MMEHVWESFFAAYRQELADFEVTEGNFTDHLGSFLRTALPFRFNASGGYIFALDGTMSDPSDIVMFDHHYTPQMNTEGGHDLLIPIETTGAVIQALDVLTPNLLREEMAHLQRVRQLPKVTPQAFTSGLSNIELIATHPYTLGLIVAWESEMTLEEIHAQLVQTQGDLPVTERTSAVFVMGQGLVVYESPQTREMRFFPQEDSVPTIIRYGEDTLAFLLLYLSSYLNSIQIVPPNFLPLLNHLKK